MQPPPPAQLLERISALPAGAPLLDRLEGIQGVYLVGGAVRDILRGGRPFDLDLVVEGDAAALASRIGDAAVVHDRFGTSTVRVDGYSYDIAQARRESYSHPGALPDVEPASLAEDLLRRDFTVNAIAITLGGPGAGELRFAPGALDDLEGGLLRVLHGRSFGDDPTRLLRLVRYAARLQFEIEPTTRELAEAAVAGRALETVSGPRIGAELRLLAAEGDPVEALGGLERLCLDHAIHPQLRLEPQLARRAIALLPADARPDLLALATAARRIPAPELKELLDRLEFEAADRNVIVAAATASEQLARALEHSERPSEVAAAVGGAGPEAVALAGALGPEETARAWLERLSQVRLEIDGGDLIAAGVPEGPAIGRGLAAALAAKLDGLAEDRDAELAVALEAARAPG